MKNAKSMTIHGRRITPRDVANIADESNVGAMTDDGIARAIARIVGRRDARDLHRRGDVLIRESSRYIDGTGQTMRWHYDATLIRDDGARYAVKMLRQHQFTIWRDDVDGIRIIANRNGG